MSKIILTICDKNAEYASRLSTYAETELGRGYEIRLFTRPEAYLAYAETDCSDLVMIGEDFLQELEARGRLPPGGTLVLTEEEKTIEGFPSASRFRSAKVLLSLVQSNYHEARQRVLLAEKTCLIGIYSPAKRCGKTTLALELAGKLSTRAGVLVLTLEDVCGHRDFDKIAGETGLSDLLYCQMVGSLTGEVLQTAGHRLQDGDVTVLPAVDHAVDIRGGDPAEYAALLTFMKESCEWSYVIVDVGDGLTNPDPVLEVCDTILVPCYEEEISLRKSERWQEGLRRESGHLRAKLREVRLGEARGDLAAAIAGALYE